MNLKVVKGGRDIWEGLEGRGKGENCVIILYYVLKNKRTNFLKY